MADTPKPLPPVQISAEDLLRALREQPLAVAEAQAKLDRERAALTAAEFDTWRHIRKLKGVKSIDSFLHQEDTGELDKNDRPKIKTILKAKCVLDSGKEIEVEAEHDNRLKELMTKRVREALGITPPTEKRPWTPLAKEFAPV